MLAQVAAGDENAMKVLFDRCYPRLYYYVFKLIQNENEARDQVQEAFMAFWQRREAFRAAAITDAEAFMITVVRNRAYNYIKHQQIKAGKQDHILSGIDSIDDQMEARLIQTDLFYRIYQEMMALPPQQAALLKMIYLEGLDTAEIAARLNTTPNNVRNQKARALEKLRTLLLKKGLYSPLFLFFF
ncbi:sigma-70 family RNA polymerase sigma factor [Chitinophaga sp. CC14]|uniref:RNA polymerase sigma factor n=1 Tax=Chitinophaga sp. CC14 TaxID=3029199 RepID=UPI003B7C12C3